MTGSVIHIYKEVFDSMFLDKNLQYTRVSVSLKRFKIGLSGDGDCDSSQEFKNLLTIIKCLVIDITVTGSANAPSFCHIYLHLGISTFLG